MSNSDLTLHGRLVRDPEMRFTPAGKAVCNLTIAVSERRRKEDGTWEDGEASFIDAVAWQQMAEAIVEEGLSQGDLIIASGTLRIRKWEGKDGKKGITPEIILDDIGRSLKWLNKNKQGSKPAAKSSEYEDEPPF